MKKDAYYFPHFSNARTDRKLKRVRKQLGVEGYGIYFMVLETLREQTNFEYPVEDIDLLSDEFGTSEEKVKAVVFNYALFEISEDQCFFSPKMIEYLKPYLEGKERKMIGGIKGNLLRYGKISKEQLENMTDKEIIEYSESVKNGDFSHTDSHTDSHTEQDTDHSSSQRKVKESKGKEKKGKESKVNNIEARELAFYNSLSEFVNQYPKEMIRAFYDYWREQNKSGTKMRFETETTWSLPLRLSRWAGNNFESKVKQAPSVTANTPVFDHEAQRAKELEVLRRIKVN